MGSYKFSDFTFSIQQNLNEQNIKAQTEDYTKDLKLIFDDADESDGSPDGTYNTDDNSKFNDLVRKGVEFIRNCIREAKIKELAQKINDAINGNDKNDSVPKNDGNKSSCWRNICIGARNGIGILIGSLGVTQQ